MRRGRSGRDDGGVTALGVLGPLLLEGDAGPVRIGSARQRRLLAALTAHLGRPVDVGRLVDLVWADDVPADPAGAVQTNVARLRRLLPDGIRLATTPEGYRLEADREVVDVTAFADHLAAATATADPSARRDRLGAALALWRGCPYPELDHPALAAEVARLAELRAGAAEQHAEALLAAGRVAEAVAELEALLATEPLREGAVAVLMRALVAAGRQSDALAAFARLRTHLAEELGLDPSPQLRDLERRVLCQDLPVPAAPATAGPGRRPLRRHPRAGRAYRSAPSSGARALSPTRTTCSGGTGSSRSAVPAASARRGWPCTWRRSRRAATTTASCSSSSARAAPTTSRRCSRPHCGWRTRARRRPARVGSPTGSSRCSPCAASSWCSTTASTSRTRWPGWSEAICAGTDRVDLLVTSREPLRVDGERVVGVEPLNPADAAALLTERMRAADPDPDGPGPRRRRARRRGLPPARRPPAGAGAGRRPRRLARALRAPPRARRAVPGPARRPSDGDGAAPVAARRRRVVLRPARRRAAGAVRAALGVRRPRRVRGGRGRLRRRRGPAGPGGPLARRAASRRPADVRDAGDAAGLRPVTSRRGSVRPAPAGPARHLGSRARRGGLGRAAVAPANSPHRGGSTSTSPTCGGPTPGCVSTGRWTSCSGSPCPSPSWASCVDAPTSSCCWRRHCASRACSARNRCTPRRCRWWRGYSATTRTRCGSEATSTPANGRRGGPWTSPRRWASPLPAGTRQEALANVFGFRGDLLAARRHGVLALELAIAAADPDAVAFALSDLALQAAYAGDHDASRPARGAAGRARGAHRVGDRPRLADVHLRRVPGRAERPAGGAVPHGGGDPRGGGRAVVRRRHRPAHAADLRGAHRRRSGRSAAVLRSRCSTTGTASAPGPSSGWRSGR